MENLSKVVLVTGASSGIGYETARALAARGWTVYAGARRTDRMEPLRDEGITPLALDVTDEASLENAVRTIEDRHGALDALVNNAGIAQIGAIEDVTLDKWRRQFEVNVFGLVHLCQLVLPAMRAKGSGRIVNVSSMAGEFTSPLIGVYGASKYALEALSDALRFEVAPQGVQVIIVQPGMVATGMTPEAENLLSAPDSPYRAMSEAFSVGFVQSMTNPDIMDKPDVTARAIADALEAETPPTRLKVGPLAHQIPATRRTLSDEAWDASLRAQYGLPTV